LKICIIGVIIRMMKIKKKAERKVIGSFEQVVFPEFNDMEITAKIDTGAYTGALHCTKINEEETPEGITVLRFSPFDHPELDIVATDYTEKRVRSSNGDGEKRYFIDTQILVRDKTYPIVLSLADRSEMKWPVLIGRRFLRQHKFLVDVSSLATYRVQKKSKS
jgi:hypothetical protein